MQSIDVVFWWKRISMDENNINENKDTSDKFAHIFEEFGNAVAEIFNDPKLKEKAKEFGEISADSTKALGERLHAEELKSRLKDVEKVADDFSQRLYRSFEDEEKHKTEDISEYKPEDKSFDLKEEYAKEDIKAATEADEKEAKTEAKNVDVNQKAENIEKKASHHPTDTRGGRVTGYAVDIFWSITFLALFNLYSDYIGVYTSEGMIPILTRDWRGFLPIFTIALMVSVVGKIILIINDRYELKQLIDMITILLRISAAATLLYLFPFDFNLIPHVGLSLALKPIISIVLIILINLMGVGVLVRFIRYVIHVSKT